MLAPHVLFGTVHELGPKCLERRLAIELRWFQQMLRLGQYFLSFRRTRTDRTGSLGVRHMTSVLLRDSTSRCAPRCASLSAPTGRRSAFVMTCPGRTSWRMLSRAHFCIRLLSSTGRTPRTLRMMSSRARFCITPTVRGTRTASWHRFFFCGG